MAASSSPSPLNGSPAPASPATIQTHIPISKTRTQRTNPHLPTPTELALLAAYPALLGFGALFSLVSPETRGAGFDAYTQSYHPQDQHLAPSYFARKDNLLNILFVKRGWFWITVSFFVFIFTHPALQNTERRVRAAMRWGVVTAWWVFVTQWFFGPAIIDRSFRWSGGRCETAEVAVKEGEADTGDVFTAAACKAAGGRWFGGHDISGHVFLLVLGSYFLLQEVGWVVARFGGRNKKVEEERSIVMHDGAVKGADTAVAPEARTDKVHEGLGLGGKFVLTIVGLCGWMLLMTAIYFHTWFEKLTGLLVALMGLYTVYVLPRWKAKANADLLYYPTQVAILHANRIPFQLRFSPALANKPKPPAHIVPKVEAQSTRNDQKPAFDPFDPPQPGLYITSTDPESHILVLNKFAIVPEHFILATKEFKPQTHLLRPDDLAATYSCITSYHENGEELFAFFNSGEHSGASQPHRHVQLLPVERMREGLEASWDDWSVLAEQLLPPQENGAQGTVPFRTFAQRIMIAEEVVTPETLHEIYRGLYRQAWCAAATQGTGFPGGEEEEEEVMGDGPCSISYNLAMTRNVMVLAPRLAEGAAVYGQDGEEVGKLSLNGTVLAGTALVKSQAEWDALRNDPGQLTAVLGKIGLPLVPPDSKRDRGEDMKPHR
ncbi:putative inositol phospholipid synthesis protein scs3p protein [Diplogelasinospora grovesii]|uniref:Acyl-coenzyme A diphosphatase SCS3 n=1 Tax=Diplogelasinospora grovesii TaxID=303347 RepID=A0AAN6S4A0_9PEZI|nr:putative inositol phospholipid synthesis protein scs3p protein [Diplogelasinospora grovesii]